MNDRACQLRSALERRRALVVPGCHDALSAKIIESAGFHAVQVSGFGIAGSLLAKPDIGLVDMKDILDITGHIVGEHELRTPRRPGPDAVTDVMSALDGVATAAGLAHTDLRHVAIGTPGAFDPRTRMPGRGLTMLPTEETDVLRSRRHRNRPRRLCLRDPRRPARPQGRRRREARDPWRNLPECRLHPI